MLKFRSIGTIGNGSEGSSTLTSPVNGSPLTGGGGGGNGGGPDVSTGEGGVSPLSNAKTYLAVSTILRSPVKPNSLRCSVNPGTEAAF